jgi:uridylate kinase
MLEKDVNFMRLVLRIGGSVIASPINTTLINEYTKLLKNLRTQGYEVAAVIGGGALAREFINIAKDLGLNENAQDEIAISVSRIFAQLFLKKLKGISCKNVPLTIEDAVRCLRGKKIVVMGGLKPGMTTDTVAALLAAKLGADLLIKASDQEGVYNKDPKIHSDARKLEHISFEALSNVLAENKHRAGIKQIVDPEAVKVLKRKRIKMIVVNGFKPRNVLAAVEGRRVGTLID